MCGKDDVTHYISTKDYFLTQKSFDLVQCSHCGLVRTNPFPDSSSINSYYVSKEYVSHSDDTKGLVNILYSLVKKYALKKKFQLIHKYSKGKTLIDYGCGSGDLVNYASSKGWNVTGYDSSKIARDASFKKYGIEIHHPEKLSDLPPASIDTITLWHVLEHIENPSDLLSSLKTVLNDNGCIFVAVPNINSFDAKFYKSFWAALDVPRHLYHFNTNSLTRLCEKEGYNVIYSKGLIFDSFYISLLSEKYLHSRIKYLRAPIIGFISNFLAFFNHKNYSSILLILQKK